MKCFCCDNQVASNQLYVVKTKNYCKPCCSGLFGEDMLNSPNPKYQGKTGNLLSHFTVFVLLITGLWVLVLLYELGASALRFFRTKIARKNGNRKS
ncbi:hypothetical protein ACVFI8_00275 [Agarivorans sp. MS3-6]|uniref:hypothetical protein n=1 Tax=Agarivorans sp. TSD2052 TaxID=2937286 RepID=UPI00200FD9DB|nr:hypothetical protein [Agarivorans sp. TSD2052]UPW20516.1 hypothetical protein M0C34_09765 [Agarivorans sp. TSD2052]